MKSARAGEHGRDFAVVAGEVRNLAQRSAEAAKEIKGLISASVERVEQGSIQRVSDIVAEISSASEEQSASVGQVSEAVGQMDRVTQQNAALVEESAVSADSLSSQAQRLVLAVSVFKLSQAGGLAAQLLPPTAAMTAQRVTTQTAAKPKAKPVPKAPTKALPKPAATADADGDWASF